MSYEEEWKFWGFFTEEIGRKLAVTTIDLNWQLIINSRTHRTLQFLTNTLPQAIRTTKLKQLSKVFWASFSSHHFRAYFFCGIRITHCVCAKSFIFMNLQSSSFTFQIQIHRWISNLFAHQSSLLYRIKMSKFSVFCFFR